MFELGKTYKFSMNKQHTKNSIYTLTIEKVSEDAVSGVDKEGKRRGINLKYVFDWIEVEDEDYDY